MTVCSNLTDGDEYGLLSLQISPYFYIGIFRLLAFFVLFVLYYYCKKYAQRTGNLGRARFFLILPIYSDYMRFLIFYCAIVGIANVIFHNAFVNPFALSAQLGGFHFFYEGLWFFLTQFGAGRKAFLRATGFGLASGTASFFAFFFATQYLKHDNDDAAFAVLLGYNTIYFTLSIAPVLVPVQHFYRRPAMLAYTTVQAGYYGLWLVSVVTVYLGQDVGYCLGASNYILFDGILKPMVIFYTLSIDSQYWQGIGVDANPLTGAWDIDMSTADTISKVDSRSRSGVPFIHFGLIELTKDMGFVAGGFSRVYFGHYKKQPIALKMLFVVDLTPESVKDFYSEAKLLIKVKNENVIECLGVSVMPPAVCIVLEFCKHGSLFDVLYKERSTKKNFYKQSLNALLGQDTQNARLLSFGSVSDNIANPLNLPNSQRNSASAKSAGEGGGRMSGMSAPDIASQGRVSNASSDSRSGISESLIRTGGAGARKSFFGRESIFGGKAAKEETKQLLYVHSQGKITTEWEKLKRWQSDNPSYDCTPIIEEDCSASVQSETMTDSILRWSNSPFKSPSCHATTRRLQEGDLLRKDLPQAVLDGLPLGHSLSVIGKLEFMSDVVRGLSYLHSRGYMHCDIKSLNFLVTENFTVKIADLGEVRQIVPEGPTPLREGEPPVPAFSWCPPEVLDMSATASAYTPASDIFGLAMVLSEIITNELPLDKILRTKKVSFEELLKILSIENKRPTLPDSLPKALRDIIMRAWDTDPVVRPSADEILTVLEQCTSILEREL
jgi:serine/threonine protein kinase